MKKSFTKGLSRTPGPGLPGTYDSIYRKRIYTLMIFISIDALGLINIYV